MAGEIMQFDTPRDVAREFQLRQRKALAFDEVMRLGKLMERSADDLAGMRQEQVGGMVFLEMKTRYENLKYRRDLAVRRYNNASLEHGVFVRDLRGKQCLN